jgi:hypothetical protein
MKQVLIRMLVREDFRDRLERVIRSRGIPLEELLERAVAREERRAAAPRPRRGTPGASRPRRGAVVMTEGEI